MVRKIITIDREKCNGCGACVSACHEGAIALVGGKAALVRDDYCDGLGNCLPACPTEAISFEEREAAAFDETAVNEHMAQKQLFQGCPGSNSKTFSRPREAVEKTAASAAETQLNQWPVQIKLVSVNAPYFNGAHVLVAADCAAYAYGNFHNEFMKNKITIIGCPKLDDGDYSEKLTEILKRNDIKSITVARIEVPCCGGLENAVKAALLNCGKLIPWQIVTFSTDGRQLDI